MRGLAPARVAAARAIVDVPEDGLRPFLLAFADDADRRPLIEVPLSLDALSVMLPLAGPVELHRVRPILLEAGLDDDIEEALLALSVAAAPRPLWLGAVASRQRAVAAVTLRVSGSWRTFDLLSVLPRLGIDADGLEAWDDLTGVLRTDAVALVDVHVDVDGLAVRLHVAHDLPPGGGTWTDQLDLVLERVGVPEPQRAWMRALHPALCARRVNPFLWRVTLRPHEVAPRFALTQPRIPATVVLKHGLDLHPDLGDLGARLGALAGAFDRGDDWDRWRIELGAPRPEIWVRA